jgi:hypothetical protein
MRQRRSKNTLTPQFGQYDYLQTIIEDQPINIRILPSLKLSLLADYPSHNEEGDTRENASDALVLTSSEVEARKTNNNSEEPSESKLTSDVNHGKKISTSDCSNSCHYPGSFGDAAHETQTWKLRPWHLI